MSISKKFAARLLLAFLVALLVATPLSSVAYATIPFSDAWFNDSATALSYDTAQRLGDISTDGILVNNFRALFGGPAYAPGYDGLGAGVAGSGNQMITPYTVIQMIHGATVVPIAHSLLGLFMLIRILQMSKRIEQSSVSPGLNEIAFIAVFFVIFSWAINNSLEIVALLYEMSLVIVRGIGGTGAGAAAMVGQDFADSSSPAFGNWFVALATWILVGIGSIVATVISLLRAIHLYILAAFSPLPFALLAMEETRSFGVGYLKNVAAVAITGAIIMLILVLFPLIVTVIPESAHVTGDDAWNGRTSLFLVLGVLLLVSLLKSGTFARDTFGG